MAYQYVAFNTKGTVVRGKLSAVDDKAAAELLNYAGYQVISLKPFVPFFDKNKLADSLYRVKPSEIVLLYRQLAMLLEAGTNIGSSIEMLMEQSTNPLMKNALRQVISDVRSGMQLSSALARYPRIFSPTYCQLLKIGEQGGELERLLRQVADYMEKETAAAKQTRSALLMPGITAAVAVIVVTLLVTFVLPSFGKIYASLGVELPLMAKAFITLGEETRRNGPSAMLGVAILCSGGFFYIRAPRGRYRFDKMLLKLPLLGRIRLLSELARYCRGMSLLLRSGMPLSDIMPHLVRGCNNRALAEALTNVQKDMVKGEGLSGPMSKSKLFLPMMVQMVKVGEETGSLDATLQTVAQSYEAEAGDRMHALIELIQPTMTIAIGGIVALIAATLMSAMTTMYGKF